MAVIITTLDLPAALQGGELAEMMVAGANAKASRVAPCLTWDGTELAKPPPSADQLNEARLVLVGAVKRWVEAGSGAMSQQSAGPFGMSVDTRQKSSGFNLWPSEIAELQGICSAGTDSTGGAFSITPSGSYSVHQPWCALNFGATYCSCGADLTGYAYPLFESGLLYWGDEY